MSAPALADPYQAGLKLSASGRHVEAIEQYERALSARPDDARVLFALGNTARSLGMAGPAEEFFRRVLAREPGRLEARSRFCRPSKCASDRWPNRGYCLMTKRAC